MINKNNIKGIGQLQGPMSNKDRDGNIINLIENVAPVVKLGIQAPECSIIRINDKNFIIGKTGILEYETGINVTFLGFETEITKDVVLDFVCREE